MKFETPKQLTTFLKENEDHPKYEELCDELAIILYHHNELHNHDAKYIITSMIESGQGDFIKSFLEVTFDTEEARCDKATQILDLSIKTLLNKADEVTLDEELCQRFMAYFQEQLSNANEPIVVKDGYWLCPDDQENHKKIEEQLEICNQIIQS